MAPIFFVTNVALDMYLPMVGGKRNTCVLNKVSFSIVAYSVNMQQRAQHRLLAQTLIKLSKWFPRLVTFRCKEHGMRRTTFYASWGRPAIKMSSLFANRCPVIGCFSSGRTTSSHGVRSGE